MKKFYLFFLFLIIAILAGTAAFFYMWNKPKANIARLSPDYSFTTAAFADAFLKDTDAFHPRYINKIIKLSGIISQAEIDDGGYAHIVFIEDSLEIQCAMDSVASKNIAALQRKDTVQVKGKYVGYLTDDIFGLQLKLNDCVFDTLKK